MFMCVSGGGYNHLIKVLKGILLGFFTLLWTSAVGLQAVFVILLARVRGHQYKKRTSELEMHGLLWLSELGAKRERY